MLPAVCQSLVGCQGNLLLSRPLTEWSLLFSRAFLPCVTLGVRSSASRLPGVCIGPAPCCLSGRARSGAVIALPVRPSPSHTCRSFFVPMKGRRGVQRRNRRPLALHLHRQRCDRRTWPGTLDLVECVVLSSRVLLSLIDRGRCGLLCATLSSIVKGTCCSHVHSHNGRCYSLALVPCATLGVRSSAFAFVTFASALRRVVCRGGLNLALGLRCPCGRRRRTPAALSLCR